MKVVVFGGTGFVGRHVCDALADQGHEVVAVARRSPEPPLPHRFRVLDLQTATPARIAALLRTERPSVVVNTVGSIWGRTDDEMWDAAVTPVRHLLSALREVPAKLVHLGSVLEYGPIGLGRTAGTTEPRPASAYGRAKLAATQAVLAAEDVDAVVLRVANVAGPGSPGVSLLGQVAAKLVPGEPAVIELAPLDAHRDYVDVRDVADAVVAAVVTPCSGAVLDIGRGEAISVRSLVKMLIDVSGVDALVVERTAPGPRRDSTWTQVDPLPAQRLLGWRPRRSPEDAVRAFWHSSTTLELR